MLNDIVVALTIERSISSFAFVVYNICLKNVINGFILIKLVSLLSNEHINKSHISFI